MGCGSSHSSRAANAAAREIKVAEVQEMGAWTSQKSAASSANCQSPKASHFGGISPTSKKQAGGGSPSSNRKPEPAEVLSDTEADMEVEVLYEGKSIKNDAKSLLHDSVAANGQEAPLAFELQELEDVTNSGKVSPTSRSYVAAERRSQDEAARKRFESQTYQLEWSGQGRTAPLAPVCIVGSKLPGSHGSLGKSAVKVNDSKSRVLREDPSPECIPGVIMDEMPQDETPLRMPLNRHAKFDDQDDFFIKGGVIAID